MVAVAVVSDSHLSARTPEAIDHWDAVVAHLAELAPDVVVHLGDLTLDGPGRPEELAAARHLLDRLPAPWHAIPGNHDIGDNLWHGHPDDHAVSEVGVERWRAAIGPDWWAVDVGGWTLVAVDAQLLGSGLDAEAAQWAWLETTLAAISPSRPLLFLSHKPLTASADELAASPSHRFVPPEAAHHIHRLLAGRPVGAVVSGHVHQHRRLDIDGRAHLWAPTTWAVLPDEIQPVLGTKASGILLLELEDDGGRASVVPTFQVPVGLRQLTLLDDIPNPYH